jgi:hypothetical protein
MLDEFASPLPGFAHPTSWPASPPRDGDVHAHNMVCVSTSCYASPRHDMHSDNVLCARVPGYASTRQDAGAGFATDLVLPSSCCVSTVLPRRWL